MWLCIYARGIAWTATQTPAAKLEALYQALGILALAWPVEVLEKLAKEGSAACRVLALPDGLAIHTESELDGWVHGRQECRVRMSAFVATARRPRLCKR